MRDNVTKIHVPSLRNALGFWKKCGWKQATNVPGNLKGKVTCFRDETVVLLFRDVSMDILSNDLRERYNQRREGSKLHGRRFFQRYAFFFAMNKNNFY